MQHVDNCNQLQLATCPHVPAALLPQGGNSVTTFNGKMRQHRVSQI